MNLNTFLTVAVLFTAGLFGTATTASANDPCPVGCSEPVIIIFDGHVTAPAPAPVLTVSTLWASEPCVPSCPLCVEGDTDFQGACRDKVADIHTA
jgi:hypothetical protein